MRRKTQVWVYSKRLHRKASTYPPLKWWNKINGMVVDFWKDEEIAYVDVLHRKTVLTPKHFRRKKDLKLIRKEWCKSKWVKT